jgi:hypothetical protein
MSSWEEFDHWVEVYKTSLRQIEEMIKHPMDVYQMHVYQLLVGDFTTAMGKILEISLGKGSAGHLPWGPSPDLVERCISWREEQGPRSERGASPPGHSLPR